MAQRTSPVWPVLTAVLGVILLIVALPQRFRSQIPFLSTPDFHLGLDLAGGTQLDFRISEDEIGEELTKLDRQIQEAETTGASSESLSELRLQKQVVEGQKATLVEAIRTVLEKRINSLGVSEATITPSYVGDEKHLLIDCPGVVDVQKCIDTVGKTIQLEFKEEHTGEDAAYAAEVRKKADDAMARISRSGATLEVLGEDLGDELGVAWQPGQRFFKDELPKGTEEKLWNLTPAAGVVRVEGSVTTTQPDADGKVQEVQTPGIFLAQALGPRTQTGRVINEAPKAFTQLSKTEQGLTYRQTSDLKLDSALSPRLISTLRGMQPGELKSTGLEDGTAKVLFLRQMTKGQELVDVSHILVTYKGAVQAPANVTRTKEEALARAKDLKKQLDGGTAFADLARAQTDAETSRASGGRIGLLGRNTLGVAFEDSAFGQAAGTVSDPVETEFGYHLIRTNAAPSVTDDLVTIDALTVTGSGAEARAAGFVSKLQSGDVRTQEESLRLGFLFFSLAPTGWKDTELDGKHFRTAAATLEPNTGRPMVQIAFDAEGGRMFQELTKRNINKRIAIFVGGELVSAPNVESEIAGGTAIITGSQTIQEAQTLARDLNTGAIPAPIHLAGQQTVEATLGADALAASLNAGLVGLAILMVFLLFMYRFLGLLADITLLIYAVIFLAILKLPLFLVTNQYVVLTLAGAAGTILSIGMAVDTNVLVFERVKEELRAGRTLKSALDLGFTRAWPSIRDSNIATLITCALLFLIGTSIVRGFAITLGLGVIVSMFTGMVIARWIANYVAGLPIAKNAALFPGMKRSQE